MHGRPRKAPTLEDENASSQKAAKLRSLQSQFLQNHHNKIYTKEALEISAKLLENNPEFYTAWNYRKLAVELHLSQSETETDLDSKSILDEELRVTESALRKNYRCYGAWYHRKWVIRKGHSSVDPEFQLLEAFQKRDGRNFHAWNHRRFVSALKDISAAEELLFTTNMINTNFSNYSAWHNRSVLLSHSLEKRAPGFFPKEKDLTDEYDLVHQALFTDPDDQSGWFYHLWLLDQNEVVKGVNSSTITVESAYNANTDLLWRPLSTNNSGSAQAWVTHLNFPEEKPHSLKSYPVKVSVGHSQGIISSSGYHYAHPSHFSFTVCVHPHNTEHAGRQSIEMISWRDENFHVNETYCQESNPVEHFDQLKIDEDNEPTASKWNLKTTANEIALFRELLSEINCKIGKLTLARLLTAHDMMMSYKKTPDAYKMVHSEEVLELYSDLMKLNPPHSQYYKDEYSLILLQQVVSSRESLLRRCFHYRGSTSSNINNYVCLRLSNLSLSRIGSIEKLLWVQMLDLSHNELQAIEGLEAMQLLACLNLSDNKLGSFTALEALRQLKSLRVLDISYNEIGAHSVGTRRYLCSSLWHTATSDWNFDLFFISNVTVTKYWEAFAVLKRLEFDTIRYCGECSI